MALVDINRFNPQVRQDNRQRQAFMVRNSETLKSIGQFSGNLLDTTLAIMDQNKKIEQADFATKVFSDFEIQNAKFDRDWEANNGANGYIDKNSQTYLTAKMGFLNDYKSNLKAQYGNSNIEKGLLAFIDNDLSGKVTDKTVMAINKNYEYGMAHVKSKFEEITEESKKAAVELDFDKVKQYYEGKYLDDMNTLHRQTSEINPAYAEKMLKASRESMSSTLLKKAGEIDMTRNSVIDVASQVLSLGTYLSENGKQYKINFLKEVRERPDMNVQDKATAITSILESDVEAHNRAISRLEDKE